MLPPQHVSQSLASWHWALIRYAIGWLRARIRSDATVHDPIDFDYVLGAKSPPLSAAVAATAPHAAGNASGQPDYLVGRSGPTETSGCWSSSARATAAVAPRRSVSSAKAMHQLECGPQGRLFLPSPEDVTGRLVQRLDDRALARAGGAGAGAEIDLRRVPRLDCDFGEALGATCSLRLPDGPTVEVFTASRFASRSAADARSRCRSRAPTRLRPTRWRDLGDVEAELLGQPWPPGAVVIGSPGRVRPCGERLGHRVGVLLTGL
jgi:hypothetical protein